MTRTLGLLAVGLYRMAGVFDRLAARVSCWLALVVASVTAAPEDRWIAVPVGGCALVASYLMVQAWREAQR